MKIATWNVNSLRVRLPHVTDWLQTQQPDILALQETKLPDPDFPTAALTDLGYHVAFAGQKTYNGVAVLSREPITEAETVTDLPGLVDPQRRVMGVPIGDLRVLNLYVPNGSEVGSEKYAYKLGWLDKLIDYVGEQLQQYPQFITLGDFNIAPDDRDVHDPDAWRGKILCSDLERERLQQLIDLGLSDTFRLFEQEPDSYSWWDYRAAGFRRNLGLRIDLILASQALSEHCSESRVDKAPRKLDRPSDHAPVWAAFSE